ncbi:MAG: HD domain-containing protein [Candidatus Heimdallarchaeota archaeon]
MISREEALQPIKNTSKYAHAIIVSRMMGELARYLGKDEREWELVGLLHDLDYDDVRDNMEQHGIVSSERLKSKLPENCLYAIKAHDYRTGFISHSQLDKALLATDSLVVLIERSGIPPAEVGVAIIRAELEKTSTRQPWHITNLLKCKEIGLNLNKFLQLCLNSLRKRKNDLP